MECRNALGGHLPERRVRPKAIALPAAETYRELLAGTGEKVAASTTGAFTRLLRNLVRDPEIGRRVVPIIPDEARTFGIDALFRRHKIYAADGQKYEPVDADLLLSYQEAADGQILEEGITEAGAMASFTAAGTADATWGEPVVPFFIYYSMFGFHRFGDLLWAAGDMRARGFLLGATAGRTTLQGEGLQHCDGHSLLFATAIPNMRGFDPAFAYEMAVIVRDGIARMYGADPEDCIYYLTLYNEAFPQPPMPAGVEEGILARAVSLPRRTRPVAPTRAGYSRAAPRCSPRSKRNSCCPSTTTSALKSGARPVTRHYATMHCPSNVETVSTPSIRPRSLTCSAGLEAGKGPVVAVTDFVKLVADQAARWMPQPFIPLGTDGFGMSDTRPPCAATSRPTWPTSSWRCSGDSSCKESKGRNRE